jgi:hypothetical protein
VIKPKGIATDCSLIASSRSSLPLNASSAIGLDKASRAHPVSFWFVAIAYTDPLVPLQGIANDCSPIAASPSLLPLNALSAIGLDKASRARPVSIRVVAIAYTFVARASIGKPKRIANNCSPIASSCSSLPLNASSAIGLDKASRAHQVSIWFVASAYTDP